MNGEQKLKAIIVGMILLAMTTCSISHDLTGNGDKPLVHVEMARPE